MQLELTTEEVDELVELLVHELESVINYGDRDNDAVIRIRSILEKLGYEATF